MRCEVYPLRLNGKRCPDAAEVTVHMYADAPAGTRPSTKMPPRRLPMTDRPPRACAPCAETLKRTTLEAWAHERATVELLPLACDTYQGERETPQ